MGIYSINDIKQIFEDIELHRRVGTPLVIIEDYQKIKDKWLNSPKKPKRC